MSRPSPRLRRKSTYCPELSFRPPTNYVPSVHKEMLGSNSLKSASDFDIYSPYSDHRKTSIICTIGPKTKSVESLVNLYEAGMSIVRMNFSHGTHKYHAEVVANLNEARKKIGNGLIGLALDTKGPEIRTGLVKNEGDIEFKEGDKITVTTDEAFKDQCDQETLYVDYKNICKVMEVGKNIFVDDGLLCLEVTEIAEDKKSLKAKVINSATISSRKGVNLPGIEVDLPAISDKDKKDINFGVEKGIDMIFASFIRKKEDVFEIRNLLGEKGKHIKIISKIENHEGVSKIDEIIKVSDGIMVARGDLGIEINAEKVFLAQKMMIAKCNIAGKPIIVATQMLDSMTYNPRPTRAEITDVANAVMDGADCVMLSGETAKGDYPCETVNMMSEICLVAESALESSAHFRQIKNLKRQIMIEDMIQEEVCCTAVRASQHDGIKAIISLSKTGRSTRMISKYRPKVPIIMITLDLHVAYCGFLSSGCVPFFLPEVFNSEEEEYSEYINRVLLKAMQYAAKKKIIVRNDKVVVLHQNLPDGGRTDTMRILTYATE